MGSVRNRFWNKVTKQPKGCWLWRGARNPDGYGNFAVYGEWWKAHRYSWAISKGEPVPSELDHLCGNRACVNPDHLDPVTHAENNRRSGQRKTHCPAGHERSPENLYWNGKNNECLVCRRQKNRDYMRRQRLSSISPS